MADDDAPPGVPEWVVTYGDMMSLLLTFFIMLVSLSEVVADKKYRQVLESLQKQMGYMTGAIAPPGKNFPLNSMVERLQKLGAHSDKGAGHGGVKIPQSVAGDEVRAFTNRQGAPTTIGPPIPFGMGEIEITAESRRLLNDAVEQLIGKPNKVEIRGHTSPAEPIPGNGSWSDDYRFAYTRARTVFDYLVERGLERDRLRIVAMADAQPLPAALDANMYRTERVELVMLDAMAQDFVGPRRK